MIGILKADYFISLIYLRCNSIPNFAFQVFHAPVWISKQSIVNEEFAPKMGIVVHP